MTRARDNPMATHRVRAVRYRPLDCTWAQMMDRLAAMNYRAAIVGPKGTGKTTLLEDLSERLAARGFVCPLIRLSANDRVFDWSLLRCLGPNNIVLLDGAEQLSFARWSALRWKARCAGGLVVATHYPGRLPTLIETATNPHLLGQIVRELLGSRSPANERIDQLFSRHGGNLREALRELYDDFALSPR